MCGGCRVAVGGETRLPAWTARNSTATRSISMLMDRLSTYRDYEQEALAAPDRRPARSDSESIVLTAQIPPIDSIAMTELSDQSSACKLTAQKMPEQEPHVRNANFHEVNLGLPRRVGPARGPALPAVQGAQCMSGCPVHGQHPALYRTCCRTATWPGRRECLLSDNALPADHRPGLPAGNAVRSRVHPRPQRAAGGHRLPGALVGDWAREHSGGQTLPTGSAPRVERWPSSAPGPAD